MKESKSVSLFDLDYTLVRCNYSYEFGRFLYQRGFLSWIKVAPLVVVFGLSKIKLISLSSLHALAFYLVFYKREQSEVVSLCQEFVKKSLRNFLRPVMAERIDEAKKRGDLILVFSSSPEFLVECVIQELSIPYGVGTQYITNQEGQFIRVGKILDGTAKLEAVMRYQPELSYVTAYSDDCLDLPLLERVGHPIVVEPTSALKHIALQNEWQIIEE